MRSTKRTHVTLALLVALLAVVATASVGSAGQTATCTIKGTNKADTLKGTSRADVICGLKGNDKIAAGKGKDRVDGGAGNDTITSVDGEVDQIDGGAGADSALVDVIDIVKNVERIRYNAPILSQFNLGGASLTVGSKKWDSLPADVRDFCPLPDEWETLPDSVLERLCRKATPEG